MAKYVNLDKIITNLEKTIEEHKADISEANTITAWIIKRFIAELEKAPTADVAPVRHGEWANEETNVTCTACGRSYDTDFEIKRNVLLSFDFCPNCGAKMDGDSNAELLETAAKPIDKNIAQSGLAPATENFELMEG